jgi:hypothetical protein
MDIAVTIIAITIDMLINRESEDMRNRNNHNNDQNRDTANIEKEFVGEIIAIFDDVVEIKDKAGKIHSFKIIGLDKPTELGDLGLDEAEKLEVGDKVRINLERGRLTSIQKFVKGN